MAGLELPCGGGGGGTGSSRLGVEVLVDGGLGDADAPGADSVRFLLGWSRSGLSAPSQCNCSWFGVSVRSWSSSSSLSSRS